MTTAKGPAPTRKQILRDSLAALKKTDMLIFVSMEALFVATYTWLLIGFQHAGWGVHLLMLAGAVRVFTGGLMLYWPTSKHVPWKPSDYTMYRACFALSALSCVGLSLWGYTPVGMGMFVLLCVAHGAAFTLRLLGATTLIPRVQAEEGKNVKLALVLIVMPLTLSLATVISSFMAEVHMRLPVFVGGLAYLYFLFSPNVKRTLAHAHKRTHDVLDGKPANTGAIALFVMAIAHNTFGMLIKWAVLPLYMWERLEHDPKKVGMALGLLMLVTLLAKLVEDEVKERAFPTQSVMAGGYLFGGCMLIGWGMTDSVLLAGLFVALKLMSGTIFTYGYLVKLEALDPPAYRDNFRRHQYLSYIAAAGGFLIAMLLGDDLMSWVDALLIGTGSFVLFAGCAYLLACRLFPTKLNP